MAQTFTSRAVRAGGFLVSEAEGFLSRDMITVLAGEVLLAGAVIGKVTTVGAITAAAKAGGNTGDGSIGVPTISTGAVSGIYRVRATGGTHSVTAAPHAGNTGNGVLTLTGGAGAAFDAATVQDGIYRLVCTTAQADAGIFTVFDPQDNEIGQATVAGAAFVTQIKFTIADGAADFIVGDSFLVTVAAAVATDSGVFSVTSPTGEPLPAATVGAAYDDQIAFTIADGATDFVVGDGFDVTVALDLAMWREYNPGNSDGTEVARGILWDDCDATAGNTRATGVTRSCEVNAAELTWFAGATDAQKAAGLADLADSVQIIGRAAI